MSGFELVWFCTLLLCCVCVSRVSATCKIDYSSGNELCRHNTALELSTYYHQGIGSDCFRLQITEVSLDRFVIRLDGKCKIHMLLHDLRAFGTVKQIHFQPFEHLDEAHVFVCFDELVHTLHSISADNINWINDCGCANEPIDISGHVVDSTGARTPFDYNKDTKISTDRTNFMLGTGPLFLAEYWDNMFTVGSVVGAHISQRTVVLPIRQDVDFGVAVEAVFSEPDIKFAETATYDCLAKAVRLVEMTNGNKMVVLDMAAGSSVCNQSFRYQYEIDDI